MLLHLAVIALQCAAVGAFLILWYFWAKKKLLCSYMIEDDDQVLFPFRYFSWILMGIVLITCLIQVHFVRTSSLIHEKLVALTAGYQKQEQDMRAVQGLSGSIDSLRRDFSALAMEIRNRNLKQLAQAASPSATGTSGPSHTDSVDGDPGQAVPEPGRTSDMTGFGSEAKASFLDDVKRPGPVAAVKLEEKEDPNGFSMRLNRLGQVTAAQLRVRKRPAADSPVMEKLPAGEQVKVTEKRLFKDNMWFRVITPSGRAGWVDYRYVKLGSEA
jgi:hypothetical protein